MSPTAIPDVPSTATTVQAAPIQKPTSYQHPLDPLTPDEIAEVTLTVRHHVAAETEVKAIKFITCYLLPAPKKVVLAHLGIPLTPGGKPEPKTPIVRKAEVDFLDVVGGRAYNVILSLNAGEWKIETFELLPEDHHPQISVEELIEAEEIVKASKKVQELAKAVGVEPHQIYCDGWSIGYDERFPIGRRVQQALVFARFSEHDNLYAHPLDFIPVIDANTREVLHIDFPARYHKSANGPQLSADSTFPPASLEDAAPNRDRIPPPRKAFDFLPDLMAETEEGFKPREGLKPLHVVQPEGVSFKVNGHELEWQNWKMHIAFSHREGTVLSTVTYNDNGEVRPILYRLSLAEMVVPYGAPEHPHPRKFAFDTGEYGMGTMANELSLGCDCLGTIHYLPGAYVGHNGKAIIIKNVICIHEEDSGVLWKHTDYRPGGRGHTARRRRLVVSMVCTLANYEYIWNYHFYQDGSIEAEIRLTGILQTYVAADDEPNPYGTTVAPQINAQNHQHIFSFRLDPMIDGLFNSIVETDVVPLPDAPTGSASNYAGNAFVARDTTLETESARPYDWEKERRWKIVNPARQHYSSGKSVGYGIGLKGGIMPVMARDDSWALRRAGFVKYPFWVVKDVEGPKGGRMWPAGKYVPQTRDTPDDSLPIWVKEGKKVTEEDLLVYLTIGTTHIPRPEDWPVMPVEHLNITLKPQSFFTKNPSMDVPSQTDPRSVAAFGTESNGANGTTNGSNGTSCH
ncbi:peroxisomal copper amine oxidase [Marasmius crinis-equi]|uniref:Amine oxidase n=1 Tax=Marasmius crinis-equi TaxID=585013 RepID=A0ABR3F8P5_9AGAR